MKKIPDCKLLVPVLFFLIAPCAYAQSAKQDTLKMVSSVGVFDGKIITVGNFDRDEVYKINEFYISPSDISAGQADSLKGKKILVTGKLKIVEGKLWPAKTSTDGKIYEPYHEPDKKYIIKPEFKIFDGK